MVTSLERLYMRVVLLPRMGVAAVNSVTRSGLRASKQLLLGECCLQELSAAAGYRTFCFPELVEGLNKSGKMQHRAMQRMLDTFEFLITMFRGRMNDPAVTAQIQRTNNVHKHYRVAGNRTEAARGLFKYIALNMFYIGPRMRPDLTPQERHAICGLTVLVSKRMGHAIADHSVNDFDAFIKDYEAKWMFAVDDTSELRGNAVEIAKASTLALDSMPTISPARIHGYVPYGVRKILKI